MGEKKQQEVRRRRRSVDQKIADLARFVAVKVREARKQARADPAIRHASAARERSDGCWRRWRALRTNRHTRCIALA